MISPSYSLRIKPHIRDLAERLCDAEERTLSNLIHVAILEYGRSRGLDVAHTQETVRHHENKAA